MKLSSVNVSLIAVFGAFQALLSTFPFTITLGVSGSITLGVIGGPLIGILLGPIIGGIATLIGSMVGMFLNPAGAIFGIFTVIPPFFGAVAAGCMTKNRGYLAGTAILASLLIFYAHPSGREAFVYPWLHIAALIVAFSPIASRVSSHFTSPQIAKPIFSIIIASFIGVMTDHIAGSAIAIWYFSLPSQVWYAILPIYPIERIVALLMASSIAIPVYYSLKKTGLIDFSL